ncbi:pentapeptide repeat-containing protein [Proteus vulgaris]|uniref:pentapeptide repeat-containing protein n=2 Tax=Proteus vulgaris TaxID=585 RepID=UPI002361501D|nr:pentapeptide repeat-containing protein [Proteus vulgaris]
MNAMLLYFKSHLFRSTVSAVDLAAKKPTESNLSFAEKLLAIKMRSVKLNLNNNDKDCFSYKKKWDGYEMLSQRLNSIKIINKCKNKFNQGSNPLIKSECEKLRKDVERIESHNDYKNINFDSNNLSNINFKNRDLSNAKFCLSQEQFDRKNIGVDFSGSCLKGVDLSNVNIDGAIFKDADLTDAKIKINICYTLTDFSNANLDGAKISFSDSEFLNLHLNEDYYENTLFKTIETISDKYKEIKLSLIQDIINKISVSEMTNEVPMDSIIKNLTDRNNYMENETISKFVKNLFEIKCLNKLGKDFHFNMEEKYINTYLDVLYDYYDHKEFKRFTLENNGSFIKLMALSLYHKDNATRWIARRLYEKYLNLEEVKPLIKKMNFSNGYHHINWKNEENNNYVLVEGNKAMITNHKNITKMLFSNEIGCTAKWDKFYLYIDDKYQKKENIDYNVLFNEDFKVFRNNRNASLNKIKIDGFLSSLNLGAYQNLFQSAWVDIPIAAKDKLVGIDKYKNLSTIFERLLVIPDDREKKISLNNEHFEDIYKNFELVLLDNKEQSKYLMSLAILIINYVDKYIFNIDNDYYQMPLKYACALMNKANELNPELMGRKFTIWENTLSNLSSENNELKLTLSKMKKYANKHFEQVYRKIIPLHWIK